MHMFLMIMPDLMLYETDSSRIVFIFYCYSIVLSCGCIHGAAGGSVDMI